MESEIKLFGLTANHSLAEEIAEYLDLPLTPIDIQRFADGEVYERVLESVRGDDAYIIAPIAEAINDAFMEIMILVDALRRSSAKTINVVLPYYGYARQDRKARSREPITAKLIASMLEMNQVDRVVALDLHAAQIQGFFDIPVDHLQAAPLLADYFFERKMTKDIVVVSADHTGAGRARKFAELLDAPWGVINDRAALENPKGTDTIVGDVRGKRAIIIDDIIDTGKRMQVSARALHYAGATDVIGVATHAVMSGDAAERLANDEYLSTIVTTNSLGWPKTEPFAKWTRLTVAPLIAEAIQRIHDNTPIEGLFKSPRRPEINI
ncbi:phosphoribosylpyrophosphate synthetase [Weissella oryzae SG25]|uniref:Ribose-phosphate pyrophosphokinase n=1 Tax=Weissella oryzae (strain DSM 25784 / JCM 18191 / LMG 30913 / SG25) TaxID=1329250 RepID=A0A069CSR2_WEIOS|nr:ribose-phosphate pyrophosphokinase [Weissella oryzae]GAK30519.1 phosphoribosylpyrophosphate synthetase [Weissella oryzae SG25]